MEAEIELGQLQAKEYQEWPNATGSQRRQGKDSTQSPRGIRALLNLALRLLASTSLRQPILAVLSHLACGTPSLQPLETNMVCVLQLDVGIDRKSREVYGVRTTDKTPRTPAPREGQREPRQGDTLKWNTSSHLKHHEHKLCCDGITEETQEGKK